MYEVELKIWGSPSPELQEKLIKRPAVDTADMSTVINAVFDGISEEGDRALRSYTEQFDKVVIGDLAVSKAEFDEAANLVADDLKAAIDRAYRNIYAFHEQQQLKTNVVETTPGVQCWQEMRPIQKVGLYIPGGTAPLFSTVLMLAVPARIAGCQEVILCSPPNQEGKIHPAILYTAQRCGVTQIFKVGGSQAIAAMVLGTESIPATYKIFGPGNQYVTAAKMKALEYGVAIDLPAGPSEALVYADETCNPAFVASDLLSQAEHGIDSQVVLVTSDRSQIAAIQEQLNEQLNRLPRKDIAYKALSHAYVAVFEDAYIAFDFINKYAPEHFIIASDKAERLLSRIQNAGSVFIGNMTPESAGDYASGTNHTLPTSAYARSYSGVSLDSFVKKITFQKITAEGLQNLGPSIIKMATEEQLEAHANAVRLRLNRKA